MNKILLLSLVLFGCSETRRIERTYINMCDTKEQKVQLAKFIVDCAKAANPLSDEEGEALVAQCEKTGRRVVCNTIEKCRWLVSPSNRIIQPAYYTAYVECPK